MSNKEELPVGLVKKKAFSLLPHTRSTMLNPRIEVSLIEFNENTSTVFRVAGLSAPIEIPDMDAPEALCKKALAASVFVLRNHPELHKVPFTIIDGTTWDKVVPTRTFGLDIQFINIFWQGEKPVIAVQLAERKLVKTAGKSFHLNSGIGFPIIFQYDPDRSEDENLLHMRRAVGRPGSGAAFYEYGQCIVDALVQTCRPELEYPVAAASYLNDVIWYVDRPGRHHHVIHSQEYLAEKKDRSADDANEVQGFLTNHGNFVGRYRGMLLAVRNNMIIDTPPFLVGLKSCEEKMYREIEQHMGGIIREEDRQAGGYRVADVALFSEDMW
ncbi:MAG TPA: hypothetical protein VF905_03255 [Nitrospirota bacterium]